MWKEIHQPNQNKHLKIIKSCKINFFIWRIKFHQSNLIEIIVKDKQKIVLHQNSFHKIHKTIKIQHLYKKSLYKLILQIEDKRNKENLLLNNKIN